MERAADWMDQAEGDLEHARHDLNEEFYDWACFSAQQSAEKALKSLFQKMNADAWGYSVADLLEAFSESQDVPGGLMEAAMDLDKAYISARYPNAHPSGSPRRRYTRAEAERMVKHAEQVLRFCKDHISTL